MPSPIAIRSPDDFAAAFHVSPETIGRLETYERLLRQWQKAVNLVAPATLDAVWHRHFADSAQLLRLAPAEALHWIDLGSGGGFPGLVIAILLADSAAASPLPACGERVGVRGSNKRRSVGLPLTLALSPWKNGERGKPPTSP